MTAPVLVDPPPPSCTCPPQTGFGNDRRVHIIGNHACRVYHNDSCRRCEVAESLLRDIRDFGGTLPTNVSAQIDAFLG